ncbi:GntR family transcriptional regulator [Devosia sp. RR2S18]|uniref:GntR family transcriptional regulator n=1 Tax=Devosia rhizosphaerae TaxID=3049774 RepID=UPI002540F5B3|nr:GntR family transcriptional regulator [Devosia sp. RR2S18]WIJ25822.1 GntR family transcriptional regulator [Devosia sp. RR2S18]
MVGRSRDVISETKTEPALARPVRLADEAYDLILDQLISLKLPPGGRITVDELSRQFGISQTPIREALGRLESDGMVIKTHLVGYRAAPQLTREQFEKLFELRQLLEPAAARRAAQSVTPDSADRLRQYVAAMREEVERNLRVKYGRFAQHDKELHVMIAEMGGNELIADALSRQHTHVHIFRLYFHSWVTESAILEHEHIVDAILAGDADRAEAAMRKHLASSWDRVSQGF